VVVLHTAPAGIFLVDRQSGEVTSLAKRGHTAAGDAPMRCTIVADPCAIDFPVRWTQAPLTCHHAVVICGDGVTSLISEREIGEIVNEALHRDYAAAAILHSFESRGGTENTSVIICDFSCPEG
jgi:hypothetical protein